MIWLVDDAGAVTVVTLEQLANVHVFDAAWMQTWCYSSDEAFAIAKLRRKVSGGLAPF